MNGNEYALKLSTLSNVCYDFIIQLTGVTVFSSKDLYDFYCMTGRFPTIEEMDAAFRIGDRDLYIMTKRNIYDMDHKQFFDAVVKLRYLQTTYSRSRSSMALTACKKQEKVIDDEIERVNRLVSPAKEEPPKLF